MACLKQSRLNVARKSLALILEKELIRTAFDSKMKYYEFAFRCYIQNIDKDISVVGALSLSDSHGEKEVNQALMAFEGRWGKTNVLEITAEQWQLWTDLEATRPHIVETIRESVPAYLVIYAPLFPDLPTTISLPEDRKP